MGRPFAAIATRRIDLYKRNSFVLEAKQSRQKGGEKEIPGQADLFVTEVGRAAVEVPNVPGTCS